MYDCFCWKIMSYYGNSCMYVYVCASCSMYSVDSASVVCLKVNDIRASAGMNYKE